MRLQMHLAWILCIGCSGGEFSASEFSASDSGVPLLDGGVESGGRYTLTASGGGDVGGGSTGGVSGVGGSSGSIDAPVDSGSGGSEIIDSGGSGGADSGGSGGVGGSGGAPEVCSTGKTRCSGSQPQVCASGEWFDSGSACSGDTPVCLNGRCVECVPGEDRCFSPNQTGRCDSTGTLVPVDGCVQCLDNKCVACDPENVRTAGYCVVAAGNTPCCTTSGTCGYASFSGCL